MWLDSGWIVKAVVFLLILAVIVGIISAVTGGSEDDAPPAQPQPRELSITDRRLIDNISAGFARLGTEYEVQIDETALQEILRTCELQSGFLDLPTWNLIVFWIGELVFMTEADYAEEIKQAMITDGVSPRVSMEEMSDVISWYKAGKRCAMLRYR